MWNFVAGFLTAQLITLIFVTGPDKAEANLRAWWAIMPWHS